MDIENAVRHQREIESNAYREFIDVSKAISTRHHLDLTIRMDKEDSTKRGLFVSDLINYYIMMRRNGHKEFVDCEMDVSEDNRGIYLKSHNKGNVITLFMAIRDFAQLKEFTTTF